MTRNHGPRIVTDGLLLYLDAANSKSYPGSGTTWRDLTYTGNDGVLTNGPTFGSSSLGNIVFDGTDDYITFGNVTNFDIGNGNPLTICLWVKTSSNISKALCTKVQTDTIESGWTINLLNTGKVNSILKNTAGTGNSLTSNRSVNDDIWHEVTVIFRPSGIASSIYIDGVFDSNSTTLSGTVVNNTRAMLLGGVTTPTNVVAPQYSGSVGMCRIYNKQLSAQEIIQNFNTTRSRFGV